MKQFQINQLYSMRSACNHDCTWSFVVIKRTANTITIHDGKQAKTCRICREVSEYRGAETIFPLGRYSMAPSLTA